uniref:Nephrocystin 3-like N-terminal domain-containing protein n=1 Tax=Moniliophthora roreri TaxID=221103 RepID=A0A0W0F9W1_MONRR
MAFFSSTQDVDIHGGEFRNVVYGNQDNRTFQIPDSNKALEVLAGKAAVNAFYDAEERFPPPNCHPGTRIKILEQLNRWITQEPKNTRVYWVHGPAGVGKSAIAQNLSEQHADTRLAASFFFSRNDSTRDKLDPFVSTIIYQFFKSESLRNLLGPLITEVIRSDPNIFHTSFEVQFRKLILEPCLRIDPEEWKKLPKLVVIDGLDECVDIPSQERLLAIIRDAVIREVVVQEADGSSECIFACPLIFLIHSRPEPRIRRGFDHEAFAPFLGRLDIQDSFEAAQDITGYFRAKFSTLQTDHHALRHMDVLWPGEDVISQLVRRACGQFIFAVTVMKYLESDDELPSERLKAILRIRSEDFSASPYPDLDLLYRQILLTCRNWDKVSRVLCLLVTPLPPSLRPRYPFFGWRSALFIAFLLKLQRGEVESLLFGLHSVIEVPRAEYADMRILHASFTEFLVDSARSGDYHVEELPELEYLNRTAEALLSALPMSWTYPLYQPSGNSQSFMSALSLWEADVQTVSGVTRYALEESLRYCQAVKVPSNGLLTALNEFDPYVIATIFLKLEWDDRMFSVNCGVLFESWKETLLWAKSLGASTPRIFVKRMETFLRTVRIGSPATSQHFLGQAVALLEFGLYSADLDWASSWRLWNQLLHVPPQATGRFSIYLLPRDGQYSFPPDWVVATLTRKEGEMIDRLLRSSGNDLIYSQITRRKPDPVKRKDMQSLERLAKKRRKELGLPQLPHSIQ